MIRIFRMFLTRFPFLPLLSLLLLCICIHATCKADATSSSSVVQKGKDLFSDQKYLEALKVLTPIADEGDREAQYYVALIYRAQKEFDKALNWFKKSANNGYSDAFFQIGAMHDNGEGVEMNPLTAMDYYRKAKLKAPDKGVQDKVSIYTYDEQGNLKPTSSNQLLEQQKQMAVNGNPETQYQVAHRLDYGLLTPRNFPEALKWYETAAENGYSEAQFILGYFYCRGIGVDRNATLANEWLIKSGRSPLCEK